MPFLESRTEALPSVVHGEYAVATGSHGRHHPRYGRQDARRRRERDRQRKGLGGDRDQLERDDHVPRGVGWYGRSTRWRVRSEGRDQFAQRGGAVVSGRG